MEVTVSSRHAEVSDALREATVEKIKRLGRFVDGLDRAEVHFMEQRNPRIVDKEVCEVTIAGHGHHIRCKVAGPDGFVAVDRAVEKLEQQLAKLKTKLMRRYHGERRDRANAVAAPAEIETEDDDATVLAEELGLRIVKTKRFPLKPMEPAEAAMQMDLLNHDFYFFRNAFTDACAVVYRRADGDIGLIEEGE